MHEQLGLTENCTSGVGFLPLWMFISHVVKGIAILFSKLTWQLTDFTGKFLFFLCLTVTHEPLTPHFLPCLFQADSASLPKKSRLPVLLRSRRPLGNVPLSSWVHKSAAEPWHRSRAPYEGLRACEVQTKPFQAQPNGELLNESGAENLPEEPAQGNISGRGK